MVNFGVVLVVLHSFSLRDLPRQELIGILSMPRNKRMRKAGIKETHLAALADVYKEVMSNALRRKEEDEAIRAGLSPGATGIGLIDKEVRVSLFTMTLGVSPFLFMREVSQRLQDVTTTKTG